MCCNEFKRTKVSAQLKKQNESSNIKENRDSYSVHKETQYESQPQEFISNVKTRRHAKSLFGSYYRPEIYAEGFTASDMTLYGRSREFNEHVNDDITLDETGYNKMLYKNYNYRKSDESIGFLSRGSVTTAKRSCAAGLPHAVCLDVKATSDLLRAEELFELINDFDLMRDLSRNAEPAPWWVSEKPKEM
ncbi:hypothetical protein EVAR_22164_1 [Eumeta japonica]|uniref:Uncharacterized protein n=1 Tax=Eumeta variegata TaxID=151549 RepID=A0A4C1W099_EUMVA|nr:hypothetical protein EVAR_22164_1 [Eumeta japonica]